MLATTLFRLHKISLSRAAEAVASFLGAATLAHLLAPAAAAQVRLETRAVNLAANAAIGAAVAGAHAALRRRVTLSAVARGAGGGVIMSLGKQLAAHRFDGAGLLGRQVHALGLPLVTAASDDTLRLLFPAGPVTLELRPKARQRWRARLDATESLLLLVAASKPRARIDWSATLSAGTPVVALPRQEIPVYDAVGLAVGGVVLLADDIGVNRRLFLPHEVIHVLQWDAYRHLVTFPLERAAVRRIPGLRRVGRRVDLGVLAPTSVILADMWVRYEHQPWEREAFALTGGCMCAAPPGWVALQAILRR